VTDLQMVQRFLGGKAVIPMVPKTELDFLPAVRKGFPWATVENLFARTGLPEEAILLGLGIPKRTLDRRKSLRSALKPAESEPVLRLARVFVTAQRVLGNSDHAREWLQTPILALGGKAPLELLDTGIGFQEVMDTLGRIEHGVYS
jgi:putative toxin-antitoxin system antitoxin component (TIGR02293 family)